MITGKCFRWFFPFVVMAMLAFMMLAHAGTASASNSVPAPFINPPGGGFDVPVNVNISGVQSWQTAYYTTDESNPETSSTRTLYTGTFTIYQSETVEAVVYDPVAGWSSVTSAVLRINSSSLVQAPSISPDGGTFASTQTVTIGNIPSGDTAYYTTDGTGPQNYSTPYTGPFTVSQPERIAAVNYSPSAGYSSVTTADFYINGSSLAPAPSISPDGGTFASRQTVTISPIGAFYTTDGSDPETSSTASEYTAPFVMWSGKVEAIYYDAHLGWSNVTSATFTISGSTEPQAPTISPDGGTFTAPQTVTIGNIPSGTIACYTTDGSNPQTNNRRIEYTGPFTVSQSEMVQAANLSTNSADGWSSVTSATFLISGAPTSQGPSISPNGGTFASPQSVIIAGIPSGDGAYYTTDGSNPTSSSTAVLYAGAFTVSQSGTVQAAVHDPVNGWGSVSSADFTIGGPSAPQAPSISPKGGTFTSAQSVTIGGVPSGESAFYTTDGSDPRTSGTALQYFEAFTVSQSGTIQAAVQDPLASSSAGWWSSVASATFTINNLTTVPPVSALTVGEITTVAGDGDVGHSGDGGFATSAWLDSPAGVAVDASGNLYIADSANNCIRKVDASGAITTVAGNGTVGYSGDGGPATGAELDRPSGVAVDAAGNLYIADALNNVIRKVDSQGIITTAAGNGFNMGFPAFNDGGYSGDGGPATSAELNGPLSVAVDASGNIYIADTYNQRIRKVDTSGIISTMAGNGQGGTLGGYSGDGGPATGAELAQPTGVAVDAAGNIYIISDQYNNCIRKVDTKGTITTVGYGGSIQGYTSHEVLSTNSGALSQPAGVAVDASGNLYIADGYDCIREMDLATGAITVVSGKVNTPGYSGDGGPATAAELNYPSGLAVDAVGDIFIADTENNRIREVKATGSAASSSIEQEPISFIIGQSDYTAGGQSIAMDASPFISNGRALVPVRYLANALGAQTAWNASTRTVTVVKGGTTIELSIGSPSFATNGTVSQMDTAPLIEDGRTYLPARYVAEALGCSVSWNAAAQTVTVSMPST